MENLSRDLAASSLMINYNLLKSRPDYDGFVTRTEGIVWAQPHPNALAHPNAENTLYLNSAKLDFGNLQVSDFKGGLNAPAFQDLLSLSKLISSVGNETLRGTVYALGRSYITLLDYNGHIRVENGSANDYDWNRGGRWYRSLLIGAERSLQNLDDTHGVRTYYYGTNLLNNPETSTPGIEAGR